MRHLLVVGLLACGVTSQGRAQGATSERAPAAASIAAIHQHLLEHLYNGITLSKEQEARVHAVIDQALKAQDSVLYDPHRQDKWAVIMAQRNAALRAVLKTEAERTKFDANLARRD